MIRAALAALACLTLTACSQDPAPNTVPARYMQTRPACLAAIDDARQMVDAQGELELFGPQYSRLLPAALNAGHDRDADEYAGVLASKRDLDKQLTAATGQLDYWAGKLDTDAGQCPGA